MPEINVLANINQLLSNKPPVLYERQVETVSEEWVESDDPHEGDARAADRATGGRLRRVRGKVKRTSIVKLPSAAISIDSEVVSVKEINYFEENIRSLPEEPIIMRSLYKHCSSGSLNQNLTLNISGTRGYSVTKTIGFTTTKSFTTNLGGTFSFSPGGPSVNAGFSMTFASNVSSSTANSESNSETIARTRAVTLNISTVEHGLLELLAYQLTLSVPFKATVIVDGNLQPNASGLTRASQLLSEEERLFHIEGEIVIKDVSEGQVRTQPFPGKPDCSQQPNNSFVTVSALLTVPSGTTEFNLLGHSLMNDDTASAGKDRFESEFAIRWSGDTIGPPTGTTYTVLYTTEVAAMAVQCGFNDLGVPNAGIFKVEAREYTTWADGVAASTWQERVETFSHCFPV